MKQNICNAGPGWSS